MKKVKIVLTGGPSAGKTTFLEALQKSAYADKIAMVPEAASILFKGGFPRVKSAQGIQKAQIAIYHTQKQLEDLIAAETSHQFIICDRGSLDGAAYWPGNPQDFYQQINSSVAQEVARYDYVIHLDTTSKKYYDTGYSIRIESYEEAIVLNEKIKEAWSAHPERVFIANQEDFIQKMNLCFQNIERIIKLNSVPLLKVQP